MPQTNKIARESPCNNGSYPNIYSAGPMDESTPAYRISDELYLNVTDWRTLKAPRYIDEATATAIDGLEDVNIGTRRQLAAQTELNFQRRVPGVVA